MSGNLIFDGPPSQMLNLHKYILYSSFPIPIVIFAPDWEYFLLTTAIAALGALWAYLEVVSVHYTITTKEIIVRKGLFSRRNDYFDIKRLRDVVLLQPFFLRLFGLGNVELITSDATDPQLLLIGVPEPEYLVRLIRSAAEKELKEAGNIQLF